MFYTFLDLEFCLRFDAELYRLLACMKEEEERRGDKRNTDNGCDERAMTRFF